MAENLTRRRFWCRFDEDNDGVISHKEMKKFVKDIQALLSPSELESIEEESAVAAGCGPVHRRTNYQKQRSLVDQAFNEMDRDGDGKVSEEEFVRATLAHEKVSTLLALKIVNAFTPE